jgi:hypothetical protein
MATRTKAKHITLAKSGCTLVDAIERALRTLERRIAKLEKSKWR